jgi:lipopolysaccharide biosynthesis glycosyltransferase
MDKTKIHGNKVESPIAVAYVTDRNYHEMTLFSLASVALSHRKPLDFFLFQNKYAADVPARYCLSIEKLGHRLIVRQAPAYAPAETFSTGTHLTPTAFVRVAAIEELSLAYQYVLYLDGDTLAFGDLKIEQFAGFPETAAACLDLSISTGFDDPSFAQNCMRNGVSPEFFNSGVLMINGKRWLETEALARFTHNLHRHSQSCAYLTSCLPNDQCALNLTLGFEFKKLPMAYNVQKSALQTRAWSTALIRHYTGKAKFMRVVPWRCDYREYKLLERICAETGLEFPPGIFDYGISYALNTLRRYRTVVQYNKTIANIEASFNNRAKSDAPVPTELRYPSNATNRHRNT